MLILDGTVMKLKMSRCRPQIYACDAEMDLSKFVIFVSRKRLGLDKLDDIVATVHETSVAVLSKVICIVVRVVHADSGIHHAEIITIGGKIVVVSVGSPKAVETTANNLNITTAVCTATAEACEDVVGWT